MIAEGEPTDDELLAALDSICPTMHVDRHVPPVFMWGTADDDTAPVAQLYPFAQRLAEAGVVHELHVLTAEDIAARLPMPIPNTAMPKNRRPCAPGSISRCPSLPA